MKASHEYEDDVLDDDEKAVQQYLARLASAWDESDHEDSVAMHALDMLGPEQEREPRPPPEVLTWGSTVCHGYSLLGKREKEGNIAAASSHDVWLEERRLLCERGVESIFSMRIAPISRQKSFWQKPCTPRTMSRAS